VSARSLRLVLALLVVTLFAPACGDAAGSDSPDGDTSGDVGYGDVIDPEDVVVAPPDVALPAPQRVTATPHAGAIALHWEPVEGALGYTVHVSERRHGTRDRGAEQRLVVASPTWEDTGLTPGVRRHYAVAAISEDGEGHLTGEVGGVALTAGDPVVARVTMAPEDLATLYARDPASNDLLPAELRVTAAGAEVEVEVRGLRFRGGATRAYPKRGFNIRLEERPDFNFADGIRRGGNRFLINALWTDTTALREHLSFAMYHALGLPAPDTFPVDLYLNDVFEGHYVSIERVDREALRGWELNRVEGTFTLVRDESKSRRGELGLPGRSMFGVDIDALRPTDEERLALLAAAFDVRGEVEDHDWEALLDLVRWVRRSSAGATFAAELAERVDLPAMIDFLAIHILSHDMDSLDVDYWLYLDGSGGPGEGRWRFIPWDKNLTFGANWQQEFGGGANSFLTYDMGMVHTHGNRLFDLVLATPTLRDALHARLHELMDEVFTRAWFEEQALARLPHVVEGVLRPPGADAYHVQPRQHHSVSEDHPHHVEALFDGVERRFAWLRHQLAPVPDPMEATLPRQGRGGPGGDAGPVWLTTEAGFVLARVEPLDAPSDPVTVRLEVTEDPTIDGVLRRYTLEASAPLDAEVTLYYRNDPLGTDLPALTDFARQWALGLYAATGDGAYEPLCSRINPYASAVTTVLTLAAPVELIIAYPP